MHASRLIGFLLEREFNHVKWEKCKKKNINKNTSCPLPKDLKDEIVC